MRFQIKSFNPEGLLGYAHPYWGVDRPNPYWGAGLGRIHKKTSLFVIISFIHCGYIVSSDDLGI